MTNTEGNEPTWTGGTDPLTDALINGDILKMGPEKFAAQSAPTYTVAPLNPERGWIRPERAAKTLAWVADTKPYLHRRVNTRTLPRRVYDSVMDLVANGLVERRDHVGGKHDGLVTLHLTELGTARLVEAIQTARAIVTGLPVSDGLDAD